MRVCKRNIKGVKQVFFVNCQITLNDIYTVTIERQRKVLFEPLIKRLTFLLTRWDHWGRFSPIIHGISPFLEPLGWIFLEKQ